MIVRTLAQAENSERRVVAENGNWQSVRLSLREDGMGHSFNITTIFKNTETHIHYQNHFESVYVISGHGEIETVADGKKYKLEPGVCYLLNEHDEHYLRGGSEDMVVACAFTPPLSGKEVHDENGVYPADIG